MTEQPNNPQPTPSGDRRLMRWILVLQVVILGWLAKNHFDGAFHRKRHTQPTVVATQPDTPPSLERSAQPNAPSSFSPRRISASCVPSRPCRGIGTSPEASAPKCSQ